MNTYEKEALKHEPPDRDWEPERDRICEHDWTYLTQTAPDGTTFARGHCQKCGKVEWSEI